MAIQAVQLIAGLAVLALEGLIIWGAVEGAHFLYCKATGRKY